VTQWLTLFDHIFKDATAERKWAEQWFAYPIQHPGTKMYTTMVLVSQEGGTLKSLLGELVGGIYGKNYCELSNKQLTGNFNYWAAEKQFIVLNEIATDPGTGRYTLAITPDELKNLITQQTISVNKKYNPEYVTRDCINYLITSNHPNAIKLENENERRFFVHEVTSGRPLQALADDIGRWAGAHRTGDIGPAALLYYLMHEVDLTDFNPSAPAPMTMAKQAMYEANLSDLEMLCRDLVEAAADGGPEIVTCAIVRAEYVAEHPSETKLTNEKISAALRKAGAVKRKEQVYDARTKKRSRVWMLRNVERWTAASDEEIRASTHYSGRMVV
jgi:hypothetical protein